MVKGISKRIIVVKAPDKRMFEEAIFIVRDDIMGKNGVTADEIVKEARRIANGYMQRNRRPAGILSRIPAPVYALLGASVTGAAWLVARLLGA